MRSSATRRLLTALAVGAAFTWSAAASAALVLLAGSAQTGSSIEAQAGGSPVELRLVSTENFGPFDYGISLTLNVTASGPSGGTFDTSWIELGSIADPDGVWPFFAPSSIQDVLSDGPLIADRITDPPSEPPVLLLKATEANVLTFALAFAPGAKGSTLTFTGLLQGWQEPPTFDLDDGVRLELEETVLTVVAIPEPATWSMLAGGLLLFVTALRRRALSVSC